MVIQLSERVTRRLEPALGNPMRRNVPKKKWRYPGHVGTAPQFIAEMKPGLEGYPSTDLNGPRIGNDTIPLTEVRACQIGVKRSEPELARAIEDVPVPQIEELGAQLEFHPLGDLGFFDQRKVLVGLPRLLRCVRWGMVTCHAHIDLVGQRELNSPPMN